MRRRGFTLLELIVASSVTSLVALAVAGLLSATAGLMERDDLASRGAAMLARAEARLADHASRARLVLHADQDEVLLWLPSEPFTSSATNTEEYDRIDANELAWYVMDQTKGTLSMVYVANRGDRTAYALSTDWDTLRANLALQAKLTSVPVLEGLGSAAFQVEDGDACSVRRFTFEGAMDEDHGSLAVHLGGLVSNGQRHPDCP